MLIVVDIPFFIFVTYVTYSYPFNVCGYVKPMLRQKPEDNKVDTGQLGDKFKYFLKSASSGFIKGTLNA